MQCSVPWRTSVRAAPAGDDVYHYDDDDNDESDDDNDDTNGLPAHFHHDKNPPGWKFVSLVGICG